MQPAELELALAALHELESRDQAILRQWRMRLERAEYEVALAERRYQEVDPANRLVAGTLERLWNDALLQFENWLAPCPMVRSPISSIARDRPAQKAGRTR